MIYYPGLNAHHSFFGSMEAALNCCSAVVFPVIAGKRLRSMDYPHKRVVRIMVFFILTWMAAVFLKSVAESMIHHPINNWKALRLFSSLVSGPSHTLHISPVLMLVFSAPLYYFLRTQYLEAIDSIYLYMPLAFAVIRLPDLVSGYGWGRHISMNLFSLHLDFRNPIPLYAFAIDIGIYLILRRMHDGIYSARCIREQYRGTVLGACFILYAAAGLILGAFTTEGSLILGLTPTQFVAVIYCLFSMMFFLTRFHFHRKHSGKRQPAGHAEKLFRKVHPADDQAIITACTRNRQVEPSRKAAHLERLFYAWGLMISYLLAIFLIFYLTRQIRIWKWPIQPATSLLDAYCRILYYLPVVLIPAWALVLMNKCREPIKPWFQWHRFSYLFLITTAVSIYYSLELLFFRQTRLRGFEFWPPVFILSIINAFAEEIMYRLALYNLIRRAFYSRWTALTVQSLIYSLIHFMIAGGVIGIFSLAYGFLLGLVVQRCRSIGPAIICHFIIDVGCIGMPLLRI